MSDYTNITVLESDKITKAIFGEELPSYTKTNPFAYTPSAGYYDNNLIRYNVALVFNTPSGRETKAYPYIKITIKEDTISGKCEWASDNETPKRVRGKIQVALQDHILKNYFKGDRLKKNYDRGIKYFVVSCGSGGSPCFKLNLEDI